MSGGISTVRASAESRTRSTGSYWTPSPTFGLRSRGGRVESVRRSRTPYSCRRGRRSASRGGTRCIRARGGTLDEVRRAAAWRAASSRAVGCRPSAPEALSQTSVHLASDSAQAPRGRTCPSVQLAHRMTEPLAPDGRSRRRPPSPPARSPAASRCGPARARASRATPAAPAEQAGLEATEATPPATSVPRRGS